MDETPLVVVATFNNRHEAELARSALDAAGIDALVQSDDGGGMRPSLAWAATGVQVIVREDDVEAAREILERPARIKLE
jgi:hypothetical protein